MAGSSSAEELFPAAGTEARFSTGGARVLPAALSLKCGAGDKADFEDEAGDKDESEDKEVFEEVRLRLLDELRELSSPLLEVARGAAELRSRRFGEK